MYGLVLEGGGGKGSFQIGACKALAELGVEISAVAGTSVGALNGAMVVQGDIDKAYDLWYDINPYRIIRISDEELSSFGENFTKMEGLRALVKKIKKVISEKGLDVEPLIQLVKSIIDEDRIRKSPIDFGMVTIDLSEKKALEVYKQDIPCGKLADYIIASASFPVFRRAVIDGKAFIDGGLYNTLPINMVSSRGCSDIITLRTYGMGIRKHINTVGLNIINISPSESLGPILDFSCERARINLKMGYFDALKVFKKLKGTKYYIRPLNDDSFFIHYLASLSDEKIQKLCEVFGIENSSGKRVIFEYLMPKVADLLGLSGSSTYEDVAIGLLEKIAEVSEVEKYKVYSIEEFFLETAIRLQRRNNDSVREIPGFLRSRELLSKLVRERIIRDIAYELFDGNTG